PAVQGGAGSGRGQHTSGKRLMLLARRVRFLAHASRVGIQGSNFMTTELPKQYDPHEAQKRWLQFWTEHGYFHSRPDPGREPFCIVIPPPNVTGALHMGHALNNTLQDVLVR